MKTEDILKKAIVEEIKNTPVDQIGVISLCELTSINRKTFYYHYRDIYDLLMAVFLDFKIDIPYSHNIKDVLTSAFSFIDGHKNFLKGVNISSAKELIVDFFTIYFNKSLDYDNSFDSKLKTNLLLSGVDFYLKDKKVKKEEIIDKLIVTIAKI